MPQHQTVDKKREILRRQLYGKEVMGAGPKPKITPVSTSSHTYTLKTPSESKPATGVVSTSYLTRDLSKILILSTIAIVIQFGLYFALNNHIIKLPF